MVDYDTFIRIWTALEKLHDNVGGNWDLSELVKLYGWSNEHFNR